MKPQKSPADLADLRRRNPKQQNSLTSRNCLSLRDNAACCIPLCVICAICGRITRKSTQSIRTEETPIRLPQISLIYADKQQTSLNLKLTVFLCVIMQLAAFLSAGSA